MALHARCSANAANRLVNDELIASSDRGNICSNFRCILAHASEILSRRHANSVRNIGCTCGQRVLRDNSESIKSGF